MRPSAIAIAVLLCLASGCTEWAFTLRPSWQFVELDMWTEVPEGQETITAKVGDILHLTLGPARVGDEPPPCTVTVNGKTADAAAFFSTSKSTSFVFRAEQAGEYRVEGTNAFDYRGQAPRVWIITVVE